MLRSAVVLAALLIFPGIALAQQEPAGEDEGPHTVERGESLWNLSRRYYDDPFQWRRILEANRDRIDDPHWIYPGQEFFIPGVGTVVTGVQVEGEEEGTEAPGRRAASGAVYPGPGDPTVFSDPAREDIPTPGERTNFYGPLREQRVEGGGVLAGAEVEHLAVSRDDFYSAAWRVPEERSDLVSYPGRVVGWAGAQAEARNRETLIPHDRIEIAWRGESPPSEGDRIHMVRVARSEDGFGTVIEPTGLARVVERGDSAVVAIVQGAYLRPQVGDQALRAVPFALEAGQYAEEAAGDDLTATLTGFATTRRIQQIGDVGFLNAGARDGVQVGDIFAIEASGGGGWSAQEMVRFRVVRVFEDRSSARVSHVVTPVFRPGTQLRRIRRMP